MVYQSAYQFIRTLAVTNVLKPLLALVNDLVPCDKMTIKGGDKVVSVIEVFGESRLLFPQEFDKIGRAHV